MRKLPTLRGHFSWTLSRLARILGLAMLHDLLISLGLVLGLLALDFAAMRWGEDTRTPALLREACWPRR